MSQVSIIDVIGNNPTIPTLFVGDIGSAVPVFNTLNIFGDIGGAIGTPLYTDAFGNTVTVVAQAASAQASSFLINAGMASFNSADFNVDSNGFVELLDSAFVRSVNTDVSGPIVPDVGGAISILGEVISAAGTPFYSDGSTASQVNLKLQLSSSQNLSSIDNAGICSFNDDEFTVDALGFVSLLGVTEAIDSIGVDATSGGGTNPVLPTAAGLVTVNGALVVAGTNPTRSVSTAANVYQIQVQTSQALAATDATKVGLCNFDSASFGVDANGFVTLNTSGGIETVTGNSGGAINPTAGNINVVTANSTPTFIGSGSTETLDFGLSNLMLGTTGPAITTAVRSVTFGLDAGKAITSGNDNTFLGWSAGLVNTSGTQNIALGSTALPANLIGGSNVSIGYNSMGGYIGVSNSDRNIALGHSALGSSGFTGSRVIAIGYQSASAYVGTEANNIIIGSAGVAAESNTIRIGTAGSGVGQQNRAFMAGITGVTVGSSAPVGVDSNGQLSSLNSIITIASGGEITYPVQPAFLAYLASDVTNKTGAGTQYNIGTDALTEVFDQGSDFNTNGTFTAPVTGKYFLEYMVQVEALSAIMTNIDARIVTSNRSYELMRINPGICKDNNNVVDIGRSALADMDVGDTSTYFVTVSNGAGDTATIGGSTVMVTSVSGYLAC